MPTLDLSNFNIVCATLGGFITLFGLVSYLLKEKFYLSEALLSTLFGVVFSPHATNWIRPLEYANLNEIDLETITLYFSRLVLGVQLVLAGVQLPSKYLWKEKKSLAILLGPGMCIMWVMTSLLVWAMVPGIGIVMAISVGACVTPTDPVLSNSIVKGKFADKNIPGPLQKIIIAESGANDGLGYPFLFLGLYLLKYVESGGAGAPGGAGKAMALWFYDTWAYVILLSIAYGALVGWLAKELLHWAEERHYVDRESFLVFAITLALFIVGTVGLIGSDDVLACFIAGNAFTWDDWFRLETKDDSLQPTIDMLLNVAIFMWFGTVCPWHSFVDNDVIPIYRLIPLGILVLLLRRLPMVLSFHKAIHQVEDLRHAGFVGFFGPIGVSAVFYLYIARQFLREIEVDGEIRPDANHLSEVINVVVWFLIVCSIVVHGLSIPLGKLGLYLPRTISTAISSERVSRNSSPSRSRSTGPNPDSDEHVIHWPMEQEERSLNREFRRRRPTTSERGPATASAGGLSGAASVAKRIVQHISDHTKRKQGTTVHGEDQVKVSESDESPGALGQGSHPEISAPRDGRILGQSIIKTQPPADEVDKRLNAGTDTPEGEGTRTPGARSAAPSGAATSVGNLHRSIRFPDEPATPRTQTQARDGD
ncbi:Na(+) H(+) antiporter isoform 3A [Lecanosticta acicola]|uniref:Na(+) H(+) antiporter isoform 3A n=1 Tax=Lecanosticta acicola TaxID=111012 RepID=A0AAI8YRX7_9PEZI|nr:Na(+) H(+) antiporter isoform 3A [Lecanosticta acicola]